MTPIVALRPPPADALVGRCFHIWGEDGRISHQGHVVARVDADRYLVQFFEWIMGEPGTMAVYSISQMAVPAFGDEQTVGVWQFYEDADHMRFWHQYRYTAEEA